MNIQSLIFIIPLLFSISQNFILFEGRDYTFSYPSNYSEFENPTEVVPILIKAPLDNSEDKFQENFNLSILPCSNRSLLEFNEDYISNITANSKLIRQDKYENGYELVGKTYQNNYELFFIQRYFKKGNSVYLLTYTGEQNNFDQYKSEAYAILESFEFR